jgi:hypothetical protein
MKNVIASSAFLFKDIILKFGRVILRNGTSLPCKFELDPSNILTVVTV